MARLLRLTDMATPDGMLGFKALVEWGDAAHDKVPSIFEGASPDIVEMAPALDVLLGEFTAALDDIIERAATATTLDEQDIMRYNRAAILQGATLSLLNHIQRHAATSLAEVIPQPDQLVPQCTCGADCFTEGDSATPHVVH